VTRAGGAWDPAAAWSAAGGEAVDVWRADLNAGGERDAALLSPDELARGARFVRDADRRCWTRAHAFLRSVLAGYAGEDPRALRFETGAHGKPRLLAGAALEFNLAHSAGVALCAVAAGREVGVDVEVPRRRRDELAIARAAFGAAEAERLAALEGPARERAFLRAWVRHEAALKCRGVGLTGVGQPTPEPAPWLLDLELEEPPGAAAALAVADGPPGAVRRWRWDG
jgi:4'-phosphopantetheinyl transferase